MAHLNTLLGPIHPLEMGITAVHEHIFRGPGGWETDSEAWYPFNITFEESYHQLMDFKLQGGQTYVDCSGIGMGRELDVYVKLADSVRQLNIIASTGFGTNSVVPPYFRDRDTGYFERFFIKELTEGMGHSLMKAGVISVGSSRAGMVAGLEERIYRAAAGASKSTGAAIISQSVLPVAEQLEMLTGAGADAPRIIISCRSGNGFSSIEDDKKIAGAGAYIAYDDIGLEEWSSASGAVPDDVRVGRIIKMLEAGYKEHILLSTGSVCRVLGWGEQHLHNTSHLTRYFLPRLREAGVRDAEINDLLVENPRRVLPVR